MPGVADARVLLAMSGHDCMQATVQSNLLQRGIVDCPPVLVLSRLESASVDQPESKEVNECLQSQYHLH